MDNLLIEGKPDDNYSLKKLAKYFAYLIGASLLVSVTGTLLYIVLLIHLYNYC